MRNSPHETDVLVVGGGLGGIAAALAALRLGRQVILTEESEWLGGQLTSQAVPPDENRWIEQRGATRSYRRLRHGIREYYRRHYPLSEDAQVSAKLNPGDGNVSRLCHEPRVALAVIEEMLAPFRADGQLQVLTQHEPVAAHIEGDEVREVVVRDVRDGTERGLRGRYTLDATETGELLELGGVEHVLGAESRSQTGELHALDGPAQPLDQQAISWCFAMDYHPDADFTIDRPEGYTAWSAYHANFWPGTLLSWDDVHPRTLEPRTRHLFESPSPREGRARDLWHYRRILSMGQYRPGRYTSDVTLVNWPQVDYWRGPIVGVDEATRSAHLTSARELSLSLLYWMQTEAPRHDGGSGYPGLRLRGDMVGTSHGLAMRPYIRESRRIQAELTILEEHVGVQARELAGLEPGAHSYSDSVGIGSYRIDLHPSTGGELPERTYVDVATYPFQIPLGALIPVQMENLLPASKNIGTTHITNGCYRLHPVEWTIGEAAGALAAHALNTSTPPRRIRGEATLLEEFQTLLVSRLGFELTWPEDIRHTVV